MEILREGMNSCVSVCPTTHIDQACWLSLLQIEERVGAGGTDRWDGVDGVDAGWIQSAFEPSTSLSRALFPAHPMHRLKTEIGQAATTTPATYTFVFQTVYLVPIWSPETFCPYIFLLRAPSPSLPKRFDLDFFIN